MEGQKENAALALSGEWDFFPSVFLEASDPRRSDSFISVPGSWRSKGIGDEGFATYRLRVRGVPDRPMALRLGEIETAYRLFANGREIVSTGSPGPSPESSRPLLCPRYVQLPPARNGVIDLVMHVSNFDYREAGIWDDVLIGPSETILSLRTGAVAFEMVMLGSLLIIGLYHVLFYAIRPVDRATLFFGAFCLIFALRISLTGERLLPSLLPLSFWVVCLKLEYFTFYLGLPVFAYYQRSLFPGVYARGFNRVLLIAGILFSLVVLFTPARIFTRTVTAYQAITIAFALYSVYALTRATIRKLEGAAVFLISGMVFMLTIINDTLFFNAMIPTTILSPFGIFSFVLAQALFFAYRFSKSFRTVERLSRRLRSNIVRLERTGGNLDLLLRATKEMAQSADAREAANRAASFLQASFSDKKSNATVKLLRLGRDGETPDVENRKDDSGSELRIDLTASRGGVEYAVLRLENLSRRPGRASMELARGLTDSLALVLENIYHARDEKLATLGSLATEIIHDLKNHTLAIKTFASAMEDPQLPENDRREILDYVSLSADQMSGLIWDILDYARGEMSLKLRRISLDPWLEETGRTIEGRLRSSRVQPVFDLNAGVEIEVDRDRFRRVIMNLVINAAESMISGGEVLIRSRREGNRVIVDFADRGSGIPDMIRERLFEPFVTAGKYQGTGLGLTVAKHIVEAHHGTIRYSEREGGGSIFSVELSITRPDSEGAALRR